MEFRFEDLEIWKSAIVYGEKVHELTRRFPRSGLFTLTTDLNRAAISMSSNIAEGSGSDTNREFRRYLGIAVKSTFETISQLHISRLRSYIGEKEFQEAYAEGEVLAKRISAMVRRLE